MTLSFEIPRLTPTVNTWSRMHWSARHRVNGVWRLEVIAALGRRTAGDWPAPPPRRVRLTVVRYSHQTVDRDNLVGGVKPLVDALTFLSFIRDDNPQNVELVVESSKGKPRVTVQLEALS